MRKYVQEHATLVIITTDTETKWTPELLFNTYNQNTHVESAWKVLKSPDVFMPSVFAKDPLIVEGHIYLQMMCVCLYKTLAILFQQVDALEKDVPVETYSHKAGSHNNLTVQSLTRKFASKPITITLTLSADKTRIVDTVSNYSEHLPELYSL